MSSRSYAGILYALAAATALGAITTQAKIVYLHGGNAMTVMLIRFVVTVLVTGLVVFGRRFWRRGHAVSQVQSKQWGLILIVGIAWSAGMICYLMSVQSISVSIAALIFYTYPLMVLGVSVVAGHVRFSAVYGALFVSAFIGLGLALLNGEIELAFHGILLALMAAIGATVTFFIGAKVASQTDPLTLTFMVSVIGLVLILPFIQGHFVSPDTTGWLALGGATVCYVIGILSQFAALSRLAPATAAFVLNFEPVVSIVLAAGFLGELLTWRQWLGVSIVMLTLLVSTRVRTAGNKN
ncbi:MAG: DMT family transporter [bacterium]